MEKQHRFTKAFKSFFDEIKAINPDINTVSVMYDEKYLDHCYFLHAKGGICEGALSAAGAIKLSNEMAKRREILFRKF